MSSGKPIFSTSRSEFLTDGLAYDQRGGCFVTTRKAIAYLIIAIISIILVLALMYFYGQNKQIILMENMKDIEELLEEKVEIVENIRLSTDIIPLHYRIQIHPILDSEDDSNFTFTGRVSILLRCKNPTNKIILNSEMIEILNTNVSYIKIEDVVPENSTVIYTENGIQKEREMVIMTRKTVKINVASQTFLEENSRLVLELVDGLLAGSNYTLDINFKGIIMENSIGLYKTSYKTPNDTVRWLATTYFKPIYARRVFPCFDEPEFKASFEISVARQTHMRVLSNMPLKETEPIPDQLGWVWDHFKVSPPMSTYVVAFTISDFKALNVTFDTQGPVLKLWAPSHLLYKSHYALKCGADILKFFELYFNVRYPLPKLDFLAVPNFEKGAVENWGIISFRDFSILWDPIKDSWDAKQHVFSKIAYEMSHQWFGNLVTIKWWSDWWLNEGFASYMSDIVQFYLEPQWESYDSFPIRATQIAFGIDELKSTKSLRTDIMNRLEIEQIIDFSMSKKGSSLLRMLNSTFEEINFRRAVHRYLNKWSFRSADEYDFWKTLHSLVNETDILPENMTVSTMMETWTVQKGFPLVTINRTYDGKVHVAQRKFGDINDTDSSLWTIPLTYLTEPSPEVQKLIFSDKMIELSNRTTSDSWILFNVNQSGYFRVNYDEQNWKLLIAQLDDDPEKIPITNRAQLFNDAFELSTLGIVNYSIPYKLLKHLHQEDNYVPWVAALNSIEFQKSIFLNSPHNGIFQSYMGRVIKPLYDKLGPTSREGEDINDRQLRDLIVETACEIGYKPCADWAADTFKDFMNSNISTEISEKLREIMYCTAIKLGDEDEFEYLWNRTINLRLTSRELKTSYLGLGCTREPWLIMRYIESSLDGSISIQNIPYVWRSISHAVGQYTGLQFLRENWDRILETYQENYVVLQAIIEDFLNSLSTESDLEDLTTFYKKNEEDLVTIAPIMKRVVNKLKLKIKWRQRNMEDVVRWLKAQ